MTVGIARSELTLRDDGRWLVTTTTSRWIFDLDLHRVSTLDDSGRECPVGGDSRLSLRGIDELEVGEPGWFWLSRPIDDWRWHFYWFITTAVTSIVRVPSLKAGDGSPDLGSTFSAAELRERLGVSLQELNALVADGRVLQVRDEQDRPAFPVFQVLDDGSLLPNLDVVIGELADSGVDDDYALWSWLVSRPGYANGRAIWELLRDNESDTAIRAAGRTAWAWRE